MKREKAICFRVYPARKGFARFAASRVVIRHAYDRAPRALMSNEEDKSGLDVYTEIMILYATCKQRELCKVKVPMRGHVLNPAYFYCLKL